VSQFEIVRKNHFTRRANQVYMFYHGARGLKTWRANSPKRSPRNSNHIVTVRRACDPKRDCHPLPCEARVPPLRYPNAKGSKR